MANCTAIIVGAGRGHRFGGDMPKQYRMLGGEPVLRHALRAFADHPGLRAEHDALHAPQLSAVARGDMTAATRAFNQMWGDAAMPWDSLPQTMRDNMTKRYGAIISAGPAVDDDVGGMLSSGGLERISVPTLLRWHRRYRKEGLAGLRPVSRSSGDAQALTDAERELLLQIRREHPAVPANVILETLLLDGGHHLNQMPMARR